MTVKVWPQVDFFISSPFTPATTGLLYLSRQSPTMLFMKLQIKGVDSGSLRSCAISGHRRDAGPIPGNDGGLGKSFTAGSRNVSNRPDLVLVRDRAVI